MNFKYSVSIVLTIWVLASNHCEAIQKSQFDILSWPGQTNVQFGCFLEKKLGYKDKRFNCHLKPYLNRGNPCTQTQQYYEGPQFPARKVTNVHPSIKTIDLSFEQGRLQSVDITLKHPLPNTTIRQIFNLPKAENYPRANVMSISLQQCGKDKRPGYSECIVLQGFDHMGAGDVECP